MMALTAPHASDALRKNGQKRSKRIALSVEMIRLVQVYFGRMDAAALRDYTFERYDTDYPTAKADLDVFDGAGKVAFQGREFRSGVAAYWRPSAVSVVPDLVAGGSHS
jgi:hypothetical protein